MYLNIFLSSLVKITLEAQFCADEELFYHRDLVFEFLWVAKLFLPF